MPRHQVTMVRQQLDCAVVDPEPGVLADDHEDQDDQCRTGAERRHDEADRHHGVEPHRTRRHRRDQEGRYGMDGQRPDDRDKHQRYEPLFVDRVAGVFAPQIVEAANDIEDQVAGEHQHVPAQHRREAVDAPGRDHVPQPVGPAHVGEDEHHDHDDGGDRQHLAQHADLVHPLVMIDIRREDDGHRPGGYAD